MNTFRAFVNSGGGRESNRIYVLHVFDDGGVAAGRVVHSMLCIGSRGRRTAGSLGLGLFPRWAMVERARAEAEEVRRCRVVKENIPAAATGAPSVRRPRPPAPGRPDSPHVTGGGGGRRSDFAERFVQRDPVVGSHIPPS